MSKAPIAFFVYNRLYVTKLAINALKNNFGAKETDLYIFSDGPKNINTKQAVYEVRDFISDISGFKSVNIYKSYDNKGLAKSIVDGVNQIFQDYNSVIVLEDDLITTKNFLAFMNAALINYADDNIIQSVNGYSLDVKEYREKLKYDNFIVSRPNSWGWATWRNRWDPKIFKTGYIDHSDVEKNRANLKKVMGDDVPQMINLTLDGVLDSWFCKWIYNHFERETRAIYPKTSKIKNLGFGKDGTHCKNINVYSEKIDKTSNVDFTFTDADYKNELLENRYLEYFSYIYKVKFRLNLLRSKKGRQQVWNEVKSKIHK